MLRNVTLYASNQRVWEHCAEDQKVPWEFMACCIQKSLDQHILGNPPEPYAELDQTSSTVGDWWRLRYHGHPERLRLSHQGCPANHAECCVGSPGQPCSHVDPFASSFQIWRSMFGGCGTPLNVLLPECVSRKDLKFVDGLDLLSGALHQIPNSWNLQRTRYCPFCLRRRHLCSLECPSSVERPGQGILLADGRPLCARHNGPWRRTIPLGL